MPKRAQTIIIVVFFLSREVLQMKFKFAVIFVIVVHLTSCVISFILGIAKDDTVEGIMREAYEEQEMLYRCKFIPFHRLIVRVFMFFTKNRENL